jgi:hypothetical protein
LALPGNRAGHRPYRVPEPSCQREDQVTQTALQLPPSTCGRAPFAANRSGGREKRQRMTSQCTARRKALLNSMHACGRMQGYLQQVTAYPRGRMCGCAELVWIEAELVWIEGNRVFGQLREEGPQARARGPIGASKAMVHVARRMLYVATCCLPHDATAVRYMRTTQQHVAGCLLHAACCVLHAACCMLRAQMVYAACCTTFFPAVVCGADPQP